MTVTHATYPSAQLYQDGVEGEGHVAADVVEVEPARSLGGDRQLVDRLHPGEGHQGQGGGRRGLDGGLEGI